MDLRALLVEDSVTDALLLERELRASGYEPVVERVDTPAALAAALAHAPWDIVISDYALPGWSGTDALAMVQEAGVDLPFILVSGAIGEEIAVQAIKAGAHDYLLKDRLARLPAAVAHALEEVALRRERRRSRAALAFLVQASTRLAQSLDQAAIADTLITLAVPLLADVALLDLVVAPERLHRVAASESAARMNAASAAPIVTVDAVTEPVATEAMRARVTVLREAGGACGVPCLSVLSVPLAARGEIVGVITLAVGSPQRSFATADVALAEELARRASLALENARLYRQAREAVAARDEFLLIAAHELKTPLTPLLLQVQTLVRAAPAAMAGPRAVDFRSDLDATFHHVQRLTRLVDQLLDVSGLGADRLQLVRERLDLAAFVAEIAEAFRPQAVEAGCAFDVRAPGSVWGCWDRTRLAQVLANLFSNAFKFGAGKPVDVRVEHKGARARLQIRDRGHGIAPADRGRIFGRFERAVSVRRYGGFGLGLWVARLVVEAHGGTISESSATGEEGATFTVELPIEEMGDQAPHS